MLCLAKRPALFLQERPWSPSAKTGAPHLQVWGSQTLVASLDATLVRSSGSLSFRERLLLGIALSQAPASLPWTERSRALWLSSMLRESCSSMALKTGNDHFFCMWRWLVVGISSKPDKVFHCLVAVSVSGSRGASSRLCPCCREKKPESNRRPGHELTELLNHLA